MKNILVAFLVLYTLLAFSQTNFREDTVNIGGIKGTLLVPTVKNKMPVVLIIAGSGPTDRDGNNPMGVSASPYKMLADSLAKYGIASLRYDKRGVAASEALLKDENNIRFDDYVNDAKNLADWLKKDSRFTKVFMAGHSEGSLIGMIAAQHTKVDGYISISGLSKTADQIILQQVSTQPQNIVDEITVIMQQLEQGKTVDSVPSYLYTLFRPSVQPYLISWFKYNPSDEIKKVSVPILILHGSTDIQIPEEEAHSLAKAKPEAKLVIIPNMNHILKTASADQTENIATYSNPALPVPRALIQAFTDFIKAN